MFKVCLTALREPQNRNVLRRLSRRFVRAIIDHGLDSIAAGCTGSRAMSSASFPSRSVLRLVGSEEPADAESVRASRTIDRRWRDVITENRLAAHAESRRRIDRNAIDPRDPRWVLAMQTQARLQGTMLTPERRDELLKSGKRLGLRAFEANLVIAVVQDRARTNQPLRLAQSTLSLVGEGIDSSGESDARGTIGHSRAGRRLAGLMRWFLAGAGAALAATAIIRWLSSAG